MAGTPAVPAEGAEPGALVELEEEAGGVENPGLCNFPTVEVGVSLLEKASDEDWLPAPAPEETLDLEPRTASETVDVIFAVDVGVDGLESTASDTVEPIFEGCVSAREAVEESAMGVEAFFVPGAEPDLVGVPLSSDPVPWVLGDLSLEVVEMLVGVEFIARAGSVDSDFRATTTFSLKMLATVASENQNPQ